MLKIKRIFSVVLCAALLTLVMCSCSAPNAEMTEENITATVETVDTALKEFDSETLDKYVDSSTLSIIMNYAEGHEQFAELGKAIFKNMVIEITEIDFDNSTVTVNVSNKNLTTVANNFASELKENYTSLQLLTILSDDDFLDTNLSKLCDDIDAVTETVTSADVVLSIEQEEDNLVLSFDDTAENAVSGGALNAIKNIY